MRSGGPLFTAFGLFALLLGLTGTASAQLGRELSGALDDWSHGEAEIVLLPPRFTPPPFARPADARGIGVVTADGGLSITLPETVAEEEFAPVLPFLEPNGCADAVLTPDDARFSMVAFGVYGDDGSLIGEVFKGSAGAAAGPVPGEYTVIAVYSPSTFTLLASCPDQMRRVVERYEYEATEGWHEVVQRFEHHPDDEGWRIDRWHRQPAPDDAEWILLRPPR